jgi:hypothetical protein
MAFIIITMFVPPLIVVLALGFLTRRLRPAIRTPLIVLSSVLLLTPSFGPATIAVVPGPFGYLLLATILGDGWAALIAWVMQYPLWHAIAFPLTALIAYLVVRWLRPNNSVRSFRKELPVNPGSMMLLP